MDLNLIVSVTLKLIIAMTAIIAFIRLSGKTQMGTLTPLDILNTFVLGAFVGGVVYNPDTSVFVMVYAIFIWGMLNLVIRKLLKFNFFNFLISGKPAYIIKDGKLDLSALKANHLNVEQVKAILRGKNIYSLLDVDDLIFETNGELTVHQRRSGTDSILLINNGQVLMDALEECDKTPEWLDDILLEFGIADHNDVFCIEWTPNRGFYIIQKNGDILYKSSKK